MRAALSLVACGFLAASAGAQVCRLSVAGLNQSRRVTGPVNAECPGPLVVHTAPFGNWGVTSNFGPKLNGHQFQGWCRDTFTCDNDGSCRVNCTDGWYEWNGCTDDRRYKAPNCMLYNAPGCAEQISPMGVNVLGTQTVDVPVRCPTDSNSDGIADQGGCKDLTTYTHGTNFMSIYELDPASPDELIQTIYYPATPVALRCDLLSCPAAGSQWVAPSFYQSPSTPRIFAEMATVVNSGRFVDANNACRFTLPAVRTVNAAAFTQTAVAPASIVSTFGESFAVVDQAGGAPPPTSIAGTTVQVSDAAGVTRAAPLFFVSPRQVNYQIPVGTLTGNATVRISSPTGVVSIGTVAVAPVAPGLFTANGNGQGVASASILRVRADGTRIGESVFQCTGQPGGCEPLPIDLGPAGESVYLVLYGTGLRASSSVTVRIGNIDCPVLYAGPQNQFAGLDQVNALLPRSLQGRGVVTVALAADGMAANATTLRIQ